VLDWSALPVVHIPSTIFLDNPLFTTLAARSIADSATIRLPFGNRYNRYDRSTRTVEQITGRPAQTIEEFIAQRTGLFTR
jgi:hypothetical protein